MMNDLIEALPVVPPTPAPPARNEVSDAQPAEQAGGSGGSKKKQGKGSRAKNDEKFRSRKNAETIANYRVKIAERFSMLSNDNDKQLENAISAVQLTPQNRAVPLSVSTRGVGFVTAIAYERTTTTWNMAAIAEIATIHQVYRVHLWLVHLKVYLAQQLQVESMIVQAAFIRIILPYELREMLLGVTRVPSVFAIILDSIGKFQINDNQYHMGYSNPKNCEPNDKCMAVNPVNIRQILEELTDVADPDLRQFFVAHNPIPGADFDAQGVLANADTIWPANAEELLAADIHAYKNWINRVEPGLPRHFFANVEWSGHATSSGSWSTELLNVKVTSQFNVVVPPEAGTLRRADERITSRARAVAERKYSGYILTHCEADFWSREKTPHTEMVVGAASLVGEVYGMATRWEMNANESIIIMWPCPAVY